MATAATTLSDRPLPSTERGTWLLHHAADRRQVGIVTLYMACLFAMYFVPACRNVLVFVLACALSFLNAVVIHNHLHKGIFKSKALNRFFRVVLSFGNLYPASANVASHNIVHHHFDDDGQPDWASTHYVRFRWHLLNLLHFPNVVGPNTFDGVSAWTQTTRQADFKKQYYLEQAVAFGLTGLLLAYDFWTALFFIVLPQLWGARGILRINLIQHDACDIHSDWNHSRNFVGRFFNWMMCNNGYHTIHHNRAGPHWSVLADWHNKEVKERIASHLDQPSMVIYLFRTFLFGLHRPNTLTGARDLEQSKADLASRQTRKAEAEESSLRD